MSNRERDEKIFTLVLEQLKDLNNKQERMGIRFDARLKEIQVELNKYNTELMVHIEGVQQNRELVRQNRDLAEHVLERVAPIETHVWQVRGVLGVIKWLGAGGLLAAIAGAARYFNVI